MEDTMAGMPAAACFGAILRKPVNFEEDWGLGTLFPAVLLILFESSGIGIIVGLVFRGCIHAHKIFFKQEKQMGAIL